VSEERQSENDLLVIVTTTLIKSCYDAKMAFAERNGITDTINKSYGCSEAITALLCY